MGGDPWSMTGGKATPDIPRAHCPGWCWDWDLDDEKSPVDPCVYEPDWDWIPIGFPGCCDGPEYLLSPTGAGNQQRQRATSLGQGRQPPRADEGAAAPRRRTSTG
eukprot:4852307-Pyramimonas_sp.AAC.1